MFQPKKVVYVIDISELETRLSVFVVLFFF